MMVALLLATHVLATHVAAGDARGLATLQDDADAIIAAVRATYYSSPLSSASCPPNAV